MHTVQSEVFTWAAQQPGITGLVLFGLGIAYAFFGMKMFIGLLPIACAVMGWMIGAAIGTSTENPVLMTAALGTLTLGLVGIFWRKLATMLACALTGGVLGLYLGDQINANQIIVIVLGGAGLILSAMFARMCPRTMPVLLTTTLGTALLVIGFVGVTSKFFPEIGGTFRYWAASFTLTVPVLSLMVFVASYSYQSMSVRGDMITGM